MRAASSHHPMPLHMAITRLPPTLVWAWGSAVVGMADDERLALRAWARGGTPESRGSYPAPCRFVHAGIKNRLSVDETSCRRDHDYPWPVADMGDRHVVGVGLRRTWQRSSNGLLGERILLTRSSSTRQRSVAIVPLDCFSVV